MSRPARGYTHSVFFVDVASFVAGPEAKTLRLARAWADRGYATTVVALRSDLPPGEKERRLGLPIEIITRSGREVLKSHRLDAAWAVRRWVQRQAPALVFSVETLVDYHVKLGLLGCEIPIVTLLGIDRWRWEKKLWRGWMMRHLAGRASAIIGNSSRVIEGYRRAVGYERIQSIPAAVVHNPIDPAEFQPRFERSTPDRLVIGGLGRFSQQKGFDLLVEAFAQLPSEIDGKTVWLRLKGAGPERAALEDLAWRLGVSSRFELVDFSPEVEPFLHSLDCLVVPSRWAGFDNVPLESILSGTVTFCSDHTGLEELPQSSFMRFFRLDPEAIAAELCAVLRGGTSERAEIAAGQRQFLTEQLAPEVIAGRLHGFLAACGLV
jgi:glycosyltransferase involved in cell wall biosynthesis